MMTSNTWKSAAYIIIGFSKNINMPLVDKKPSIMVEETLEKWTETLQVGWNDLYNAYFFTPTLGNCKRFSFKTVEIFYSKKGHKKLTPNQ